MCREDIEIQVEISHRLDGDGPYSYELRSSLSDDQDAGIMLAHARESAKGISPAMQKIAVYITGVS
jgi:hypothetical protein